MKAIEATVALSMSEAENAIRCALAEHGFGVLTEIDVAATLKAKLNVDRPPLKILGACNPTLAHQALQLDPSVSLLLPCNVVIEAVDGATKVAAVDPHQIMDDPRFAELADDAAGRLRAALESVASRRPRPHTQPGTEDLRTYRHRSASGMPETEGTGDASDDHTHHNHR
jgi:uncharacterized protein (DUF302 family)